MRTFVAMISLFLTGCVGSSLAGPAQVQTSVPILSTETATPEIQATMPSTADACPAEVLKGYLDLVLPLADQHTVDSYQAQKMEKLADEEQIKALRKQAADRLVTIQEIQAPICAQEIHAKLMRSFELLIQTWDQIGAREYEYATSTLKEMYIPLADATVLIAEMQSGER